MPVYTFRCTACRTERDIALPVDERDESVLCSDEECLIKRTGTNRITPGNHTRLMKQAARMVRVPTAANFEVKGYSAKNGYSK